MAKHQFLFRRYVPGGRNGYYGIDIFRADGSMPDTAVIVDSRRLGEAVAGALHNVVRDFIRTNNLAPGRRIPDVVKEPEFVVRGTARNYSVRDVTNGNRDMIGPSIPTKKVAQSIANALSRAIYDFRNDNSIGGTFRGDANINRIARKMLARGIDPAAAQRMPNTPTYTRGGDITQELPYDDRRYTMWRMGRVGPERTSRTRTLPLAFMEERAGLAKKNKRPAKKRAKRAPARRRTRR